MERQWMGSATALSLAVAISGAVLLTACGGGSGGGEAAPSMVPTPPAVGKVLYADASVLRPTRNGARYTYRGVDRPWGEMTYAPTIYWKTVAQASGAGDNTTEYVETKYDDTEPEAESYALVTSNGLINRGGPIGLNTNRATISGTLPG